jgi:translation initiation factor IF-3
MFIDKGKELMLKLILELEEFGSPESLPSVEGKRMLCNVKPKSKK